MTMKCDKEKRNRVKDVASGTAPFRPRRPESRRDREVHRRLTQQAPRFLIPTIRVDGIFWKKTEEVIKERLDKHDYFPFGVVSPFGVYRLQYTQDSFWYGVAFACALLVSLPYLLWTRGLDEDYGVDIWLLGQFAVALFCAIFVFLSLWWWLAKSCLYSLFIDCQTLTYEVYRGNALTYRGHFHNIYVKLKTLQTRKDRRTRNKDDPGLYYLILGGAHFAPIYLSSHSKSYHELRRLGKRIATNFNLNFVDMDPVSKHHQIRHRCPYSRLGGDDDVDDALDSFFEDDWTRTGTENEEMRYSVLSAQPTKPSRKRSRAGVGRQTSSLRPKRAVRLKNSPMIFGVPIVDLKDSALTTTATISEHARRK